MRRDLRVAYGAGISLRRLRGWAPKQRLIPDGDSFILETEPEFDKREYELFTALHEYEQSLGDHGLPLDETMSPLADPDNPNGQWTYKATALKDYAKAALEAAQEEFKDHPSQAREWRVEKIMRA